METQEQKALNIKTALTIVTQAMGDLRQVMKVPTYYYSSALIVEITKIQNIALGNVDDALDKLKTLLEKEGVPK